MASSSQECCQTCQLTLGRTRKSITHRSTRWWWWVGGGVGLVEPLPKGFDMLQFFETISPSLEGLLNKRQKNFSGGFVQIFLKFSVEINSFFLVP